MSEFKYDSLYYEKTITLKYLDYNYLMNSNNILLIGSLEDIDADCFKKVNFHFVLTRFAFKMTPI